MDRVLSMRLAIVAVVALAGCELLAGIDEKLEAIGGAGGVDTGGGGAGGDAGGAGGAPPPMCAVGLPDSTPFCIDGTAQVDCATRPDQAGYWLDTGPEDRFAAQGGVLDTTTELLWSTAVVSDTNFSLASDRCSRGFTPPTRLQLMTILDFGRIDPPLDPLVFAMDEGELVTRSTTLAGNYFLFNLKQGEIFLQSADFPASIRCVGGLWTPAFTTNEDVSIAREEHTGLEYQTVPMIHGRFEEAVAACDALNGGDEGCSSWRVPSLKEVLLMLTDDEGVDSLHFEVPRGFPPFLWSSTPVVPYDEGDGFDEIWVVAADGASFRRRSLTAIAGDFHHVYCVRSPRVTNDGGAP